MGTGVSEVRRALAALGSAERATAAARYFKTGKGEYGEGDVFLGVPVPQQRKVARAFAALPLPDVRALLKSKRHEERLTALMILVRQYERGDEAEQRARYDLYLRHTKWVNNWDLVDSSAPQIVGGHLLRRNRAVLTRLAKSKSLWERRIAVIATYAFIRAGEAETTFALARLLMDDPHDLIHKAVGWMLREVGKRVGEDALRGFLDENVARLPRTALRYAIERLPPAERKAWLSA